MPRHRTWTDEQFTQAARNGRSIRAVLLALGLHPTGANYLAVHSTVARLGLDTSHWVGEGWLRGGTHDFARKRALAEILVEKSTYMDRAKLKKRLLVEGLLVARCAICGLSDWRGEPLSLVLDHVNGVHDDHRLENLRLLCPNCNSQQPTFAGRNKRLLHLRRAAPGAG